MEECGTMEKREMVGMEWELSEEEEEWLEKQLELEAERARLREEEEEGKMGGEREEEEGGDDEGEFAVMDEAMGADERAEYERWMLSMREEQGVPA